MPEAELVVTNSHTVQTKVTLTIDKPFSWSILINRLCQLNVGPIYEANDKGKPRFLTERPFNVNDIRSIWPTNKLWNLNSKSFGNFVDDSASKTLVNLVVVLCANNSLEAVCSQEVQEDAQLMNGGKVSWVIM